MGGEARNSVKIFCYSLAALLIAAAGITAGYLLRAPIDKFIARNSALTASPETLAALQPPAVYNNKTYRISPPSRGAFIVTVPMPVLSSNADASTLQGILPAARAASVKTGQPVYFLLADGSKDVALGTVAKVAETPRADKAYATVDITVSSGKITDIAQLSKAEIITERRNDAERLPLSAIVMKDQAPYVWETVRNNDGTVSAYRKRTNLIVAAGDMAVVANPTGGSNIYVLDPDEKLVDGGTINTEDTLYAGAEQTDEQIVTADIERYYPKDPGPDPYTGPDFPSSCGLALSSVTPVNASQDFIAKIRSLAQKRQQ